MVYGHLFEDSYVKLEAKQNEDGDPAHHPRECSIKPKSYISYSYLMNSECYIADAATTDTAAAKIAAANTAMRLELAQAWYEATTFWTTDPSTIASSLSRFKWSAGLEKKPIDLIKHVEIWIPVEHDRDTAKEATILERFESLFQLNKQTIITIALQDLCSFMVFSNTGNGTNINGLEDYAERVEYLLEPLASLRGAGYKVIIRAEQGLNFVVEPDETNLEEWTKKIRAAIIEEFPNRRPWAS
ncbi:hypothetical protein J4E90_010932 [Alternaria incomplexa]|uniref:uncharacterized protein n=1 Tax=Alternaria incomplexa TaxID=1187928 RepID=UPI00221F9EE0|nr:uncharacterized protein J4E90_010932 [Alternaria incomplexa]KAI4906084.1 hypothetical protein J4E90_010932 [Alternaria incomplexa]